MEHREGGTIRVAMTSRLVLPPQSLDGLGSKKQTNSHVFQRLCQIRNQILDILDADRDANERIGKADLLA